MSEDRADSADKLGRLSGIISTASRLVRDCAWVQPDEEVVIVTDAEVSPFITHAIAGQVLAVGARPNIVEMPVQFIHGNEPTRTVAAACMEADVIFGAVSKSITHTQCIRNALEKGHARYLGLSHVSEDSLIQGAATADPKEIRALGEKLRERLLKSQVVRVTSDLGMDVSFSVQGRRIRVSDSIIPKNGTWQGDKRRMFPDGECHVCPIEESVNGRVVVDRWMQGFGFVDKPIEWDFKDGKCYRIEGGTTAAALRHLIETEGDEYSRYVGEFAIGINPQARVEGNPHREGKKILGSIHFALGTGTMVGGKFQSNIHLDGVSLKPSIFVDGKAIVEAGKIVI